MHRSMFQVYVNGSIEAAKFYMKAFGAKLVWEVFDDDKKFYLHSELDVYGQILAVGEATPESGERIAGNTMQLCFHFGEGKEDIVRNAYEVLKDGAQIHTPIGQCFFSKLMFGLIDKYGVNWCVFV